MLLCGPQSYNTSTPFPPLQAQTASSVVPQIQFPVVDEIHNGTSFSLRPCHDSEVEYMSVGKKDEGAFSY